MAPKNTQKQDSSDLKDLNEESKEVVDIESVDRIVNELEESATDDVVTEVKPDKKGEEPLSETHLKTLEQPNVLRRFAKWFWDKKWFTLPGTVLLVAIVLLAVPVTRYAMTSWFWKESMTVTVTDDTTKRPVTDAAVSIAGVESKTNANGQAHVDGVPVGWHELRIEKKHYKSSIQTVEVPWFAKGKKYAVDFQATGRLSEITVVNRLSGAPVKAALVTVAKDKQATTDAEGKAQLILPINTQEITVTVHAEGYVAATITIKQSNKNQLQLLPAGKLYFLSKQRGKLDVVQTNLDGSERKAIVEGTGHEDEQTALAVSADWKYLLLKAKRSANKPAGLYLFDTAKNMLEPIEEAGVESILHGWAGHNFYYATAQADGSQMKFKSINATSRKQTIVEDAQEVKFGADIPYMQLVANVHITDNRVTYTKGWGIPYRYLGEDYEQIPKDKLIEIVTMTGDGGNKKVLKTFPSHELRSMRTKQTFPQTIQYKIEMLTEPNLQYGESSNGAYKAVANGDQFGDEEAKPPVYLMSPNGSQSLWTESRNNSNVIVMGDKNGQNKKEITNRGEFRAYGWFTDDYVVLQKANNELYIATFAQLQAGHEPLRVGEYFKPENVSPSYGHGYGGQ